MPNPSLKQELHELADHLPEGATLDYVIEQLRYRKAVQEGMDAADRGEFASDDEIRTAFGQWGVKA